MGNDGSSQAWLRAQEATMQTIVVRKKVFFMAMLLIFG